MTPTTAKSVIFSVGLALLAQTCAATFADDSTTTPIRQSRTTVQQEPAFVSPGRLAPLTNSKSKDFIILTNPKPTYDKRLAEMLNQINMGETKGWITSDVAADLKRQQADIVTLAATIHDPLNVDRATVDSVESKITALNAAVYAAFNKKEPVTDTSKEPVKELEKAEDKGKPEEKDKGLPAPNSPNSP